MDSAVTSLTGGPGPGGLEGGDTDSGEGATPTTPVGKPEPWDLSTLPPQDVFRPYFYESIPRLSKQICAKIKSGEWWENSNWKIRTLELPSFGA